ncbi:MAG: choice-of-anchor tandem repeat GloVer-containing protein [Terriglobia bacterium]
MRRYFILSILILGTGACAIQAQTYTNLYSFSLYSGYPPANTDGALPQGGLVITNGIVYGTTDEGGSNGVGTVFAVHADGSGFASVLHTFGALYPGAGGTNADGANPHGNLTLVNGALYGTTYFGGFSGAGTLFRVNLDGSGFTNLHNFSRGADGADPNGGLILASNYLYGTAAYGGNSYGYGSIYRINTNGSSFTNLYGFSGLTDGALPEGNLLLSGSTLYGTCSGGGAHGSGDIFSIGIDGKNFSPFYSFDSAPTGNPRTNLTGAFPQAALILVNGMLYCTTQLGGTNGTGSIFAVQPGGSGFANLHSFAPGHGNGNGIFTNLDGVYPLCTLTLANGALYGTTQQGGSEGVGAIFSIQPDGTGFTNLYTFVGIVAPPTYFNTGGAEPDAGFLLGSNVLYGTSSLGGIDGNVFSFTLASAGPPPLTFQRAGAGLTLTWPSGYVLQSTPDLGLAFSNVTSAASPYTVTATNAQEYFRLKQ